LFVISWLLGASSQPVTSDGHEDRVGFLPAESCFCQTCGLNQFKPD